MPLSLRNTKVQVEKMNLIFTRNSPRINFDLSMNITFSNPTENFQW